MQKQENVIYTDHHDENVEWVVVLLMPGEDDVKQWSIDGHADWWNDEQDKVVQLNFKWRVVDRIASQVHGQHVHVVESGEIDGWDERENNPKDDQKLHFWLENSNPVPYKMLMYRLWEYHSMTRMF